MKKRHATAGRSRNRRHGFTMVELLLVLVILAILAGIVVPKFTGRSEQARVTAARTEMSGMETALNAFEVDHGRYPEGGDGLKDLWEKPDDLENWRPYLSKPIDHDPWGNAYIYECPGKHNEYGFDLSSCGPDGKSGTDDDIVNWKKE